MQILTKILLTWLCGLQDNILEPSDLNHFISFSSFFFFLNMQIRRQKKKTDGVSCPYVIENETFQAFDPIVLLFVLQTKCTNWRKTRNKSSRNQTTGWETGDGSRIFVHVELLCIHILQSDCVMCMRVCRIYFTIVIFSTRPRFIPLIFPSLKWINRK